MLHHALALCRAYPFKRVVINTHYLHDQISKSIENFQKLNPSFPEIIIIYEQELLETGGAIKNAQEQLGKNPIFALNTDIVLKSDYNIFTDMTNQWNPEEMDFLLRVLASRILFKQ